jgi:hypothetical protein
MGIVPVRDLSVGAMVATDVVDRSGRVLLRSGSTIEDRHLRILAMWGVTEVDVAGESGARPDEGTSVEDDVRASVESETAAIFALANRDHPAMEELARLSAARRLGKRSEESHGS